MKTEQLQQIKERLAKATPGPWDSEGTKYVFAKVPGGRPNGEGIVTCGCYAKPRATADKDKANADFIAHAPEDIAALIEEVEWCHKMINKLSLLAAEGERIIVDQAKSLDKTTNAMVKSLTHDN